VKSHQVVELAPFLFLWAAEQSLRRRRERINDLDHQLRQVAERGEQFPHLHPYISAPWQPAEIMAVERTSIAKRDLFGRAINDPEGEFLHPDYSEEDQNPIATFLKDLAAQLEDAAGFEGWDPDSSPNYSICKEEALSLVDGDEEAASSIVSGVVPLHELPKELRAKDRAADRATWVRTRAEEIRAQTLSLLADLDITL
jgi:hypothetical protein